MNWDTLSIKKTGARSLVLLSTILLLPTSSAQMSEIQNAYTFLDSTQTWAVDHGINLIVVMLGLTVETLWSMVWMRTMVGSLGSSNGWKTWFWVSALILGATAVYMFTAYFYATYPQFQTFVRGVVG